MAKPEERQRVAEEVQATLQRRILTGVYPPGSKLPPERELARALGVNRASIREALKKLEHIGLIRARQGDGTRVTHFMDTAGIELVAHLLPVAATDPSIVRDILEVRGMVGREVARLAALRADPSDLVDLRGLAARAAAPGLAAGDIFELDYQFYAALTTAGKNKVMGMLINTMRTAVNQYRPLLAHLIVSQQRVCEHHEALITAVAARDAATAAALAQSYLQEGNEYVVGLLDRGALALAAPQLPDK
jgi:GntR family transcriptional repressor for pyruvate dehydrogenase complex